MFYLFISIYQAPPEQWLNTADDVREVKWEGHVRVFITPVGSIDRRFFRRQGLCQAGLASIGRKSKKDKDLNDWCQQYAAVLRALHPQTNVYECEESILS